MQEIEQKAIETFSKNLAFLQEYDTKLYEKIDALTLAIDKGYYKEKYSLEYKDSYFDVLELESGKWLYGVDSNEHAALVTKSISFVKKENAIETFKDYKFSKELADELASLDVLESSYAGVAHLIHYANEYAPKESHMKKIYKFIFVGVGLGLHLTATHEKLHSNIYYIIEDDLELFRLSLFTTDYAALTDQGAELLFSVFTDEDEFKNLTQTFLYKHFTYNHYLKFFHLLSHSEEKLSKIHRIVAGQTYLSFNYAALTTTLTRPLEHLKNGYNLLNIGNLYNKDIFKQKPVLIIGAGPSFGNNIEWIKENHDKYIVVIVSALMSKFEELGIKPNIITHIHGFKDAMPHIQKVKDMSFFDETISLFGAFTSTEFLSYFKKENIFLYEGSSRYKRWNVGITSSNIGSITYGLFLMFQTKNIYLLGVDFALDQQSGSTHSKTHEYVRDLELKEGAEHEDALTYISDVIKVKGNFQEEVFTTLLMNGWKDEANAICRTYRTPQTQNVYNLSDGAYIDETIPLYPKDTSVQNLPSFPDGELYDELFATLSVEAENYLNAQETEILYAKEHYCRHIEDVIEQHFAKPYTTLNQYHYDLLGLFINLLAEEQDAAESMDIDYIVSLYSQFVAGFVFDLINTAEIEDELSLMQNLDEKSIPTIKKVVVYFKEKIEEYLEARQGKEVV